MYAFAYVKKRSKMFQYVSIGKKLTIAFESSLIHESLKQVCTKEKFSNFHQIHQLDDDLCPSKLVTF